MKRIVDAVFLFLGLFLFQSAFAQKAVMPLVQAPKDASQYVEIDDADHDFGNIQFKKAVDYRVHVQNISKDTITLANVQVSCGCTIPEWKRGPYAPRDTFSIKVSFNGYADGKFVRTLTLLFNDKEKSNIVKVLTFRGVGFEKLPVAVDYGNDGIDDIDDIDAMASTKKIVKDLKESRRNRYYSTKIR
ncbi:MAG: hypothetical protein DI598_10510 [Pseudopedobacter saltans]|uniref:DUF1573 domain-containing protein n=1 Tax=Pseudopedobacter saltans TaxID=151895 RepID=A0A2W5EXH7_9SPHI|nr:MAG: hypothetical protein DI598_10510 [Pseudopedobacter saltans]